MKRLLYLLLVFSLLLPAQAELAPSQVVVVFNADSELSTRTAKRYAQLRRIPVEQVVGLHGLKSGHIKRIDFEEKIRMPLMVQGHRNGWRWPSGYTRGSSKRILAMVLMPDLPLGIMGTPRAKDAPRRGPFDVDHAAVDSELMLLGSNAPAMGILVNPCFGKEIALDRDFPPVMAVCRIDGPDEASIMRMIEDPPRVEQQGLWGWTVVDQGGPHKEGDEWMGTIARQAQALGQPLFYETSRETLPEAFPLMADTALYFGWYAYPANGPFNPESAGDFCFAPGAVAVHIHSNSASSVKNPRGWVGAMLSRGAAVTAGNVFEPYLTPTLHLDVFYDRLMKGHCVAEASLMASYSLSWQCIVMGDPLYRPFAALNRGKSSAAAAVWHQLRQKWGGDLPALERAVRQREKQPEGAALAEMLAWFCTENKHPELAYEFFSTACGRYTHLRDRTRTAIMAATILAGMGKKERALSILRPWLERGSNSPYFPALQKSFDAISGEKNTP